MKVEQCKIIKVSKVVLSIIFIAQCFSLGLILFAPERVLSWEIMFSTSIIASVGLVAGVIIKINHEI